MWSDYLDFERPLAEFDSKIEELQALEKAERERREEGQIEGAMDISDEIIKLRQKCHDRAQTIYNNLTPWQIAQLARHPKRPHAKDYIRGLFEDFEELKGDRAFSDDAAIVAGLARLGEQSVAVIGHQKGRSVQDKVKHNFGMPKPEGYRKALRVMELAERFQIPILTFIDTPGAYPGIDAEQRGQSEAIARNIQSMSALKVPILATVIGEGGSGGALAIGVCDHLQMLQYSTYSVISPEGCASILWKNAEKAADAAVSMGLTADRLKELALIDEVLPEPFGGAHRDPEMAITTLKTSLMKNLERLLAKPLEGLLNHRYDRLMSYSALA